MTLLGPGGVFPAMSQAARTSSTEIHQHGSYDTIIFIWFLILVAVIVVLIVLDHRETF